MADLPTPAGWFAVTLGHELRSGQVTPARVGGQELVVWRDEGGTAHAAAAWCPHLGAHLGHLGKVRGEALVCGFHGFAFGGDGACLATGYGGRIPPRARLGMWPTEEVDGVVLAYHDAGHSTGHGADGQSPPWRIPPADAPGWTRARWRTLTFTGHPLDITENSVDVGHLRFVHGYGEVQELTPADTEGPLLTARYGMTRPGRIFGVPVPAVRVTFDVAAYGLGFSRVDLTVHTLGAQARLWVLPTPLGDGTVRLRIGARARRAMSSPAPAALRALPTRLTASAIRDFALLGLVNDVAQDRRVWATKRHLVRPAIAEGDGPIGPYRRWADQFLRLTPVPAALPGAAAARPSPNDTNVPPVLL
jgi:nitrite reductase/ring-hydroxylating ferredoxin subunit